MLFNSLIKTFAELTFEEFKDQPIILMCSAQPKLVATANKCARRLGIRNGMRVELINYFCWAPIILTIENIEDISPERL